MKNSDKTLLKYTCPWPNCGYEFERYVAAGGAGKHGKVSTQVKCPRCGNFLKTWGGK